MCKHKRTAFLSIRIPIFVQFAELVIIMDFFSKQEMSLPNSFWKTVVVVLPLIPARRRKEEKCDPSQFKAQGDLHHHPPEQVHRQRRGAG